MPVGQKVERETLKTRLKMKTNAVSPVVTQNSVKKIGMKDLESNKNTIPKKKKKSDSVHIPIKEDHTNANAIPPTEILPIVTTSHGAEHDQKVNQAMNEKEKSTLPSLLSRTGSQNSIGKWLQDKRHLRSIKETTLHLSWFKYLRSWMLYLAFLILFVYISFQSRYGHEAYYFTQQMKDLFIEEEFTPETTHIKKSYHDIATSEEWWQWMEGPLFNGLFPPNYKNGLYQSTWYRTNETEESSEEARLLQEVEMLQGYWKLVGGIRLRQLRVRQDICQVNELYNGIIPYCYPAYEISKEEHTDFGPIVNGTHLPGFSYSSAEELSGLTYWGYFSTYGGGGYVIDLEMEDDQNAWNKIQELKKNSWIDRQTRAVFIDFTVYNANMDLYCVVRIFGEFPQFGGVIPKFVFRTQNIFRYEDGKDVMLAIFEGLFFVFVIYYIIEGCLEAKKLGWKYLRDAWAVIDIFNLSFFVLVFIVRMMTISLTTKIKIDASMDTYINFQPVAFWIDQDKNLLAANSFLSWFKIFKYMHAVSPSMNQLVRTLAKASISIVMFLSMFSIVFLGYAQAGYMAFGVDIAGFRSLGYSVYTLFTAILGDFDFASFYDTNRLFGPLFFFSFMILLFFILMNMFIAIINEAYEATKSDAKMNLEKKLVGEQWKRFAKRFKKPLSAVSRLSLKKKRPTPQKTPAFAKLISNTETLKKLKSIQNGEKSQEQKKEGDTDNKDNKNLESKDKKEGNESNESQKKNKESEVKNRDEKKEIDTKVIDQSVSNKKTTTEDTKTTLVRQFSHDNKSMIEEVSENKVSAGIVEEISKPVLKKEKKTSFFGTEIYSEHEEALSKESLAEMFNLISKMSERMNQISQSVEELNKKFHDLDTIETDIFSRK